MIRQLNPTLANKYRTLNVVDKSKLIKGRQAKSEEAKVAVTRCKGGRTISDGAGPEESDAREQKAAEPASH